MTTSRSTLGQVPDTLPTTAPSIGRASRLSVSARVRTVFRSDSEGGALVEVAATLPILLLIMTGIFSFSVALNRKMELSQATGTGGRVLAVARGQNDPCLTAATAMYAAAPGLSQSEISLTFVLGGVSTGATCPGVAGTANLNLTPGGNANVTASYPCNLNVYGHAFGSCTLTSQITEIVQ